MDMMDIDLQQFIRDHELQLEDLQDCNNRQGDEIDGLKKTCLQQQDQIEVLRKLVNLYHNQTDKGDEA